MTLKEKLIALNIVVIVYAMKEEEYEEYLAEAPECWKLPYNIIEEYLPAIIFINDKTWDEMKMKGFFDYYLEKQAEYPEKYRITQEESKIAKYIIEKEVLTEEFWTSVHVLIEQNEILKNDFSDFMIEKAKEFLNEIGFKKPMELSRMEFNTRLKQGFRTLYYY